MSPLSTAACGSLGWPSLVLYISAQCGHSIAARHLCGQRPHGKVLSISTPSSFPWSSLRLDAAPFELGSETRECVTE